LRFGLDSSRLPLRINATDERDLEPMTAAAWAVVVAAVALVVSGVIAWRQVVWGRRAANAQERLTLIEAGRDETAATDRTRAQVTVRYVKERDNKNRVHTYLVVENYGDAPARDVILELVSRDDSTGSLPRLALVPFPATIGARSDIRLIASSAMGTAAYCDAVLRWHDGAGPHEERLLVSTF
jgi:hypothetical protein